VDPLTGEGVALGLSTARAAVECALAGEPERYEALYRRLTRRHRVLTTLLLRATRSQARTRALIRAARTLPPMFDRTLGWLGEPGAQRWRLDAV
jgi:flavin-dependent dehydrogenase